MECLCCGKHALLIEGNQAIKPTEEFSCCWMEVIGCVCSLIPRELVKNLIYQSAVRPYSTVSHTSTAPVPHRFPIRTHFYPFRRSLVLKPTPFHFSLPSIICRVNAKEHTPNHTIQPARIQQTDSIPLPFSQIPVEGWECITCDRTKTWKSAKYQLSHSCPNLNKYFSRSEMSFSCPPTPHLFFHKIHFTVRKRVRFGQGVFVCGDLPELGGWAPQKAFRLRWNDGDVWTGHLLLAHNPPPSFEYKFIIATYDSPSTDSCEWQTGSHNRRMDLQGHRSVTLCDDRWNMDRVVLNLRTGKSKSQEEKYYVVGDISELGCWREKKLMKRSPRKCCRKENIPNRKRSTSPEETDIYTYSFYTFRGKEQFYYYFIRKGDVLQSERKPGRVLIFARQSCPHPYRQGVTHPRGEINVTDECNIHELVFSRINSRLCVGGYPRDAGDIRKLKQEGVTGILSIQSDRDYNSHGLSPHYLSLLCEEAAVRYQTYSIEDMNNQDFIERAQGAVRKLRDMLRESGKVYVHCTAGIYRSPQIIALYLAQFQDYSVEQAVDMIKMNHPLARPNCKVISEVYCRQASRRVQI